MARRFAAQLSTCQKGLTRTMERMGVSSYKWVVEDGCNVTIMFVITDDHGTKREYHYIADQYVHVNDNFRAAQLALDYLWRIHEDYCVRAVDCEPSLETIFQGFRVLKSDEKLLALPDPTNKAPWEILDIPKSATSEEIQKAYRELSKVHHPDHGGDNGVMEQINIARDEMLEALN